VSEQVIVLDSSAILAILFGERDSDRLVDAIEAAPALSVSVANALECAMKLAPRPGLDESDKLDAFFALYEVRLAPVDVAQFRLARAAYLQFGKGRHAASLNFGDCFAYSLAKSLDAPLLFVGGDFAKTDLTAAA
jgi:ribonuclease VapC